MQHKEALPIGTKLDSGIRQYTIKSILGQGGFGITYLATSQVLVENIPFEVPFAIKEHYISTMNERQGTTVSVSNANNTDEIKASIDNFLVEAQRLNKLSLNHPGIVRVNESFRANSTAYYVMEYVKGQSLREFVKQSSLGRLSELEALQLFHPIAETIGYLHDNHVTHLDIKPDNVLIRENGQPVIIDFGLSKHYSSKGTPTSTIKAAGCSAGYSPMEQYVGINTFTPEADIYALAATLLYMLTGKDPMNSTEINEKIIRNSFPQGISESVSNMILKSMEKLKEYRTSSIDSMISLLNTTQIIMKPNNKNKTKGRKWLVWGLSVVLVILIAVMLLIRIVPSFSGKPIKQASDCDSLAYILGMANAEKLKDTLNSRLGVDSTLVKEFIDGIKYGMGVGEYPNYVGKQEKAFNAGKSVETTMESKIQAINKDIFVNDISKGISKDYFMIGFIDALERNYSIMDPITAVLIAPEMKTMMRDVINREMAIKYLHKNISKMVSLPNGIRYKEIKKGKGVKPLHNWYYVNYKRKGILLDGTQFDQSDTIEKELSERCDNTKIFEKIFLKMPVGSIWEVYIPVEVANESFSCNSPLIFKIELIETYYY